MELPSRRHDLPEPKRWIRLVGPGAIMVRDNTHELEPGHWLYDTFTHTRGLGEKDLSLALKLGESVGVDLPLAEAALRSLAAGLGVPHRPAASNEKE